ncbi:kinesin family member 22 [Nematocida minor]|uniref:kinesin family member 22 n=1 Tax=Nematocida minor TaxID=1912983 RepID=UPI002220D3B0|nr:kinesin family member 22 [Nematocida minor]KAI5191911.1 kinesin family member 22 [Nematocida minor]
MAASATAIKTILRVRPPHKEKGLRIKGNTVHLDKNAQEELLFVFDAAHKSSSTQQDIYAEVESYLDNIARGINTSILAYGATGSGKTHTMCGTAEDPGIIPRMAEALFGRYSETLSILFKVRIEMSYIEIYNEKVYDLLGEDHTPLPVREDSEGKVVVQGVREEPVANEKEFYALFRKGGQRRKNGKTLLNVESSRSHAIVSLFVVLSTDSTMVRTKINLVDLAGSENNKRTGNEGMSMVESASINRSLFVLNKVIESLAKGACRVPYRDSKLTRILQDSLGGMSDCALIVNITGDSSAETASTLAFAGKSRQVKLKPQKEKIAYNKWTEIVRSGVKSANHSANSQWRKPVRPFCAEDRGFVPSLSSRSSNYRETSENKPYNAIDKLTSKGITDRLKKEKDTSKKIKKVREHKLQSLESVLEIVNSGDFLRIKSLPMIGDQRAEKIIKYAQKKAICDISELMQAGITKKIIAKLVGETRSSEDIRC